MTFHMKTLITFLKRLKILVEKSQIYETIPIELLVDMKNLLKIVEITDTTMLEIFVHMNAYL